MIHPPSSILILILILILMILIDLYHIEFLLWLYLYSVHVWDSLWVWGLTYGGLDRDSREVDGDPEYYFWTSGLLGHGRL